MTATAQIIQFPGTTAQATRTRSTKKRKPTPAFRQLKYFTKHQIKFIRRQVRDAYALARAKAQVTAIREWMLIDILTRTGLRSAEAADLRCGDVLTSYGESSLFVRAGKGYKTRYVEIQPGLKTHLNSFIKWKEQQGEPTGMDDHLFLGQRGPWTPAAVQQCCKKWIRHCDLDKPGLSAHTFRHSYAVELYQEKRCLRTVQKQLGHASIQTTQIYADVTKEDIQDQIKGMWN
ncbi:tyrosine-type recombinase/integrase [Desulfobacter postgatei]|uniref:Site-specific recombinase XerD n=1 Tax=Desulfobacter postgatei 2ac9 TaxID=879212 RepID=I5B175_9BACT|nr:tyrosine-type recombinase/integrase [Desulfobacter postgatei]EIM63238.1 site-specific recombinase XerD [Desulfobacter postgatei 2ac9]